MTQRQIIAEQRKLRVDLWLMRQPLTPSFNSKLEAAEAFRKRLNEWVAEKDTIAPSFHL